MSFIDYLLINDDTFLCFYYRPVPLNRIWYCVQLCNRTSERIYGRSSTGNCPAQSNFNLIKEWPLPIHGTVLLYCIGLCAIDSRYCPWSEKNIKLLRRLQRLFHHAPIPIMSWSPCNISLFVACKPNIVSSPLLLRYDSFKLVFLKTDWSAHGMWYILTQSDNCSESLRALKPLENSSDCTFELSLEGPRLHSVLFESRSNLPYK